MAGHLVSKVAIKLSELVASELKLLHGVRDKVRWLESELRWIQGFLKDADAKGKGDERVKNWVDDVTEVAYQAEAAIDTFLTKVRRSKGINGLKARHDVGVEIGKIKKRLNEIKARREVYGIRNLDEVGDALNLMPVRRHHFPSPVPVDADIVGRFDDEKILLERLMNHQQQGGSCVISIVGLGGIGKTTLARKLYRSKAVSDHFHKPIWVTVSQENSLKGLLMKILKNVSAIGNDALEGMEENDLIERLTDSLRAQRFLIVLDDVWREDICIQMEGIFRNVHNGSRILITTRFHNVAQRANPSSLYQLPLLNEDESMKLLLKRAFSYDQDADQATNCSDELRDIGLHLVHKCGRLPLALVVLGGFLSMRNKTPVEWRRVLETMDWEVEGSACQEILALSYEDLPGHMKLCFLYLGAYPEDYEIFGTELIRKWVAEGFIPQDQGKKKTKEETGEAILEELAQRSLIHVNKRKANGCVKTCGVHDLLLDFARSAAKKDRFLTVCSTKDGQPIPSPLSHRVAIHINDTLTDEIDARHELRTLMVFASYKFSLFHNPIIVSAVFRFQLLRVLDLSRAGSLLTLPKEIKLMIHLRYLRLFHVAFSSGIPASIGKLQLLETIDITYPPEILPMTLWKIKTLRHVLLPECIPPQILKLEDLLTLDSVAFGSYETINWSFPNLRKFKVLINKEHHGTILAHLLSELGHLISLHIKAQDGCHIEIDTTKDFPFHNRLLSLTLHGPWPKGDTISEFPINLTKLELCDSELMEDPMPKLGRLQFLVTLKLLASVYLGKSIVCLTGGFPRLETLFITNWFHDKKGRPVVSMWQAMQNLEEWIIEEGAMPELTFLQLTSCELLKKLPDFQHVMSLQKLELYGMSQELMRRSKGEDLHKIQHVPKLCRFTTPGVTHPYPLRDGKDTYEGEFSDAWEEDLSRTEGGFRGGWGRFR